MINIYKQKQIKLYYICHPKFSELEMTSDDSKIKHFFCIHFNRFNLSLFNAATFATNSRQMTNFCICSDNGNRRANKTNVILPLPFTFGDSF